MSKTLHSLKPSGVVVDAKFSLTTFRVHTPNPKAFSALAVTDYPHQILFRANMPHISPTFCRFNDQQANDSDDCGKIMVD
jgi:hypothetical protein